MAGSNGAVANGNKGSAPGLGPLVELKAKSTNFAVNWLKRLRGELLQESAKD